MLYNILIRLRVVSVILSRVSKEVFSILKVSSKTYKHNITKLMKKENKLNYKSTRDGKNE